MSDPRSRVLRFQLSGVSRVTSLWIDRVLLPNATRETKSQDGRESMSQKESQARLSAYFDPGATRKFAHSSNVNGCATRDLHGSLSLCQPCMMWSKLANVLDDDCLLDLFLIKFTPKQRHFNLMFTETG